MKQKISFKSFALIAIPLIMSFFFIRNIYHVNVNNLDSWLGGGFRMFASLDIMAYRVAGFVAEVDGEEKFVNLRTIQELDEVERLVRIMPSDERLDRLNNEIKSLKWCINDKGSFSTYGKDKCDKPLTLKPHKVIVYRIDYDTSHGKISLMELNKKVYVHAK